MAPTRFAFPPGTLAFLADLGAHNAKPWFDANRNRYESDYLSPAVAFVEAIDGELAILAPGIATEPRVNGSIFRINRDVRFSRDKTPYKDHLDFWFWRGERRTALSGLFLRIAPSAVTVGAGAHGFDPPRLARCRAAIADPAAGGRLVSIAARLEDAGHEIGGETLTRTPRGFTVDAIGSCATVPCTSTPSSHRRSPPTRSSSRHCSATGGRSSRSTRGSRPRCSRWCGERVDERPAVGPAACRLGARHDVEERTGRPRCVRSPARPARWP